MKDFRPLWKERAQAKSLTFLDCIQRCILTGMHRGEDFEEKVEIALNQLDRAFSPKRHGRYDRLARELRWASRSDYGIASKLELDDEEKKLFERIGTELQKPEVLRKLGTYYSYIFVFGKLIPEQVAIQGMHASMALGERLTKERKWPAGCDACNLHYAMIDGNTSFGENTSAHQVGAELAKLGVPFSTYRDHDYWFDDEGTLCESQGTSVKSIMTYPIPRWRRGGFEGLQLLRF